MSDTHGDLQSAASRPMRIADAARHLGVSERTVYRMLKSGKLRRVSVSDNSVAVSCKVTPMQDNQGVIEIDYDRVADTVSDKMTDILSATFTRELEARDREIERLLAVQQEQNQTIQRLQDQLFELARLIVSNSSKTDTAASETPKRDDNGQGRGGLFPRWLGKRRNT